MTDRYKFRRSQLDFIRISIYNKDVKKVRITRMFDFISVKEAALKWEISEKLSVPLGGKTDAK